jgi:hypothetical protein
MFTKKPKDAVAASSAEPVARNTTPVDVEDVSFVEMPSQEVRVEPSVGGGLFLNAKPAAPASENFGTTLRARFARKSKPGTEDAVEASAAKPGAKKSTFNFPWKKKDAQPSPELVTTEDTQHEEDARPVRPTQPVKKPIIVRKASDTKKKKSLSCPIRVFIGFLPEVTERDARDYAFGVAERNCEQISISYFDAFKMNDGYAYEVHEGGSGRAFLPEIIKYFAAQSPFAKGAEATSVVIRTGTRTVQVERTLEGLQAFLLPEDAEEVPTDWLEPTTKMTPAIQTMTGVLVVGAALFTTGFLAMTLAMVSRIQPYDPPQAPAVKKATESYSVSPLSRWSALQAVSTNEYIKALRFSKGKWDLERGVPVAEPTSPAVTPMPAPASTSGLPSAPAPVQR